MKNYKIAVLGLGYVGLPLAHELAKKNNVIGFDINSQKIEKYKNGIDVTEEIGNEELGKSRIEFTSNENKLKECNVFIVSVPTPINQDKTPNLLPIIGVSELIGKYMQKGSIVIYESTVYPGTTEEICLPILENISNLTFNEDFEIGYSPERINPGDKMNTVRTIKKIISASSEETLNILDDIYSSVVDAGLYRASSIKVAEAAKVIENSQRDVNIAFMNEIAMVFNEMDIDTQEVLDAASTKWNFLNFKPGLVGGHCIGVDPYYFIYKAEQLGYRSQIISSARRINDEISNYVSNNIMKYIIKNKIEKPSILCLGLSFKENCADIRNTKVIDILDKLKELDVSIDVYEPIIDEKDAKSTYGIDLISEYDLSNYNIILLAVPHDVIISELNEKISNIQTTDLESKAIFDIKGKLDNSQFNYYWSL